MGEILVRVLLLFLFVADPLDEAGVCGDYRTMSHEDILKQDPKFFDRADEHIRLSNSHLTDINPGKASASMMYATARFNAYVSWIGFSKAGEMADARDETIRFFVEQYQAMLEENLDDYINNFDTYLATPGG